MANKVDLVNKIAETTGYTKKDSLVFVEGAIEAIKDLLLETGNVNIKGFCKIEIKEKKEKKGYNLATKKSHIIPAGKKISFCAGTELKELIT